MATINVFLVDDSATVRKVLNAILEKAPGIEVIGTAINPIFAWKKMQKNWPDVIISDIEMPEMDGITFLNKIMKEHPTPVIICSGYAATVGAKSMEAMAKGAVEIIHKPTVGIKEFLDASGAEVIEAVRGAALAKLSNLKPGPIPVSGAALSPLLSPPPSPVAGRQKLTADAVLKESGRGKPVPKTEKVIAIGCSTGGTQAIEVVLSRLTPKCPGILIVQHMPAGFTKAFANRLNQNCPIDVKEAESGDPIRPGCAYIAPGDKHLMLRRMGSRYEVEVKDGPLVSRHKPSVDVLFRSTANAAGSNAAGIIMTGMGDDGAKGLLEMRQAGAVTYGQDENTCVVYGMPKVAFLQGAVNLQLPLQDIAAAIMQQALSSGRVTRGG